MNLKQTILPFMENLLDSGFSDHETIEHTYKYIMINIPVSKLQDQGIESSDDLIYIISFYMLGVQNDEINMD